MLILQVYSCSLCIHTQLQSDINVQEFVLELLEETKMYENNKKVRLWSVETHRQNQLHIYNYMYYILYHNMDCLCLWCWYMYMYYSAKLASTWGCGMGFVYVQYFVSKLENSFPTAVFSRYGREDCARNWGSWKWSLKGEREEESGRGGWLCHPWYQQACALYVHTKRLITEAVYVCVCVCVLI